MVSSNEEAGFAEEFPKLVKQWEAETSFHSSLGEIFTNEAYQRIMARGDEALPLILSDLQRKPRNWFYALEKLLEKTSRMEQKTLPKPGQCG